MSQTKYQKREVCLIDIPSKITKKDIDLALKGQKFQLVSSFTEKKINVEFKNAQIAWEVRKFLLTKKLIYKGKPFRFVIKGNRLLVHKGMEDASFDELRAFFNNYGEVNGIYLTQQYFALLATITQAIELVEKVRSITIDGGIYQFKYAFDNNPYGSAGQPTGNFEIKERNGNGNESDEPTSSPKHSGGVDQITSALAASKLNFSSCNSVNGLGNSANGGHLPSACQKKKTKKKQYTPHFQPYKSTITLGAHQPKPNPNVGTSQPKQVPTQPKPAAGALLPTPTDNVKVNSLKLNTNTPLFARGPETLSGALNSLEKLNYHGPDFKSIDYLENKKPQQPPNHPLSQQPKAQPQNLQSKAPQPQQTRPPLVINTNNVNKPATVASTSTSHFMQPKKPNPPTQTLNQTSVKTVNDKYHYVAPEFASALNSANTSNPSTSSAKPTGNVPPFATPASASSTSTAQGFRTAGTYGSMPSSTTGFNTSKPAVTPKQPSPYPTKVNHYASPSKPSKKEEANCSMM